MPYSARDAKTPVTVVPPSHLLNEGHARGLLGGSGSPEPLSFGVRTVQEGPGIALESWA